MINKLNSNNIDRTLQEESMIQFQREIEEMVFDDNITFLDAIQEYCDERDIEYESVVPLISPSLLRKVMLEAKKMKLVKGYSNPLPGIS